MRKRVISGILAFAMVAAIFVGSCSIEVLGGFSNLVTASAAELTDETIKTKFNKTLLFADDEAFDAELARFRDELLPEYEKAVQKFETVEDVAEWLVLHDESTYSLYRLEVYAMAGCYIDGSDSTAVEQYNRSINLDSEFEQLNMNAIDLLLQKNDAFLNKLLTDEKLEIWHKMLFDIINSSGMKLNEDERNLLMPAEKSRDSYEIIYSTLIDTDLVYESITGPDGNMVEANYTNRTDALFNSNDREYRKEITEVYNQSLKNYENTFAGLFNGFVITSESIAQRNGYASVLEINLENDGITKEIYMNFINTAHQNTDFEERYINIKKKALGYDVMYTTDRYVSICKEPEQSFKFEDSREILTKALAPLGDEYIEILNRAYDEGWIDVYPDENKTTGGAAIAGAGTAPCVIVNYMDNYYSLSILAHELGHAINSELYNNNQSSSYCKKFDIFSCEIASITNELLLARYMQDNAKTDEERLYYLLQEYITISSNFFSTAMNMEFENEIRDIVNNGGVLTADRINEVYGSILDEYYKGIEHVSNYDIFWTRISQYYNPYYSKAYGFSVSAACNVVNNIENGSQKATDNYIAYLKAGASRNSNELYALVGSNLTDPSFVQPLLDRCDEILDESEVLIDQRINK